MLRSAFGLVTVFVLLILAGAKQLQLTEVFPNSKWQCSRSFVTSTFRILIWLLSDEGRAIIAAVITALGTLSLLYRHPIPEARELAITIVLLLAFLSFIILQSKVSADTRECIHPGSTPQQPRIIWVAPPSTRLENY
jgi:hypothetical protein